MLNQRLPFKKDLAYPSEKAGKVTTALIHIMSNIGGFMPPRKLLLERLCANIVLYPTSVSVKSLNIKEGTIEIILSEHV